MIGVKKLTLKRESVYVNAVRIRYDCVEGVLMKRFAIPIIVLVMTALFFIWWLRPDAVTDRSDRARDGLKGNVQTVTVETAPLVDHFGEFVEAASVTESQTTYSEDGKVLDIKRYRSDNTVDYAITYGYENDVLVTEETFDDNERPLYKWLREYNSVNLETSLSGYDADGQLDFRTVKEYDNRGQLLKETSFNPDETFSYVAEFTYTRGGSEKRTTFFTPGNVADYTSLETFDTNGNRLEESATNTEGELEYRVTYTYDGQGKLLEETAFRPDGSQDYRLQNDYDNGNLVKITEFNEENEAFYTYTYVYDDQGNMTERVTETEDGMKDVYRFSYEYDEAGNWVRRETQRLVDKFGEEVLEPTEVTHRSILYFEQ
jgi:YD repeat-containing protein